MDATRHRRGASPFSFTSVELALIAAVRLARVTVRQGIWDGLIVLFMSTEIFWKSTEIFSNLNFN
jgi:hypothetical protein